MKKILFFLVVSGFLVVTSCKKEDNTPPVGIEEVPPVVSGNNRKVLEPYD
jgi:hypothetical protein